MPPELREGRGEVGAAAAGRLPALVERADIRGLVHVHTTWSDGRASVEDTAIAARARGFEYLVVCDHSRSTSIAGGLTIDEIRRQIDEIRAVDARLEGIEILSGSECDILPDGSLDYPDDVLAELDCVVASVHGQFRQSRAEATARIETALANPWLDILGHPMGRILLARDVPAPIVHDCVVAAEEVLANIATHAYGGRPGGEASVEIRLLPEEIRTRFADAGPPFNPLEEPAPDVEAPIATRSVGGLGIFLVRQLADRCEYVREGSTNVLTVHHRRPAVAPREAFTQEQEPLATPFAPRGGAMALDIEITNQEPAGRRVKLRGRLDTLTAPQLETALAPLLDSSAVTSITFGLDGLEYMSSAGIRCLMRAHKALAKMVTLRRGNRLSITPVTPAEWDFIVSELDG